jgi:hypothetical protein
MFWKGICIMKTKRNKAISSAKVQIFLKISFFLRNFVFYNP